MKIRTALLGLALISTLGNSAVEAKGRLHRRPQPEPTEQQRLDAQWIQLKIERCVVRMKANNQKLDTGGGSGWVNFRDDEDYERVCLGIVSMRG